MGGGDGPGRRLTPAMRSRKLQALDFIKRYWARWGRSPSQSEVAGELGVSRERAKQIVHRLARDEMIRHVRGKARGIALIDGGEQISEADALLRLASEGYVIFRDGETLTKNALTRLPLLDHVPPEIGVGPEHGAKPG